jgi:hypothetical protein
LRKRACLRYWTNGIGLTLSSNGDDEIDLSLRSSSGDEIGLLLIGSNRFDEIDLFFLSGSDEIGLLL